MLTIVQKDNPVLREKAKTVSKDMFKTPALKKIIKDMREALASQDDGVALAAPQIALSLRIFVLSGKVFEMINPDEAAKIGTSDIAFINPKIVKISRDKKLLEEGCLSVRHLYGKIKRSTKARVRAQNENGETFEMSGSGLLAQIFQHETDHLDGVLFIDKAKDLKEIKPEIK